MTNRVNGHTPDWQETSMQKIRNGLLRELQIEALDQDEMDIDGEDWQVGLIRHLNLFFTR
jgi:hypothetical protein